MRLRPRHVTSLLPALLLAPAACTVQAPTMHVLGASVVEESPDAIVVHILVEGENPNPDPLPLRTARYTLDVDGRRVFSGERSAEATLRRLGAQRFVLPAVVSREDFESVAGREFRVGGNAGYVAPGVIAELLFDTNIRRPDAPISGSGVIGGLGTTLDTGYVPPPPPAE